MWITIANTDYYNMEMEILEINWVHFTRLPYQENLLNNVSFSKNENATTLAQIVLELLNDVKGIFTSCIRASSHKFIK